MWWIPLAVSMLGGTMSQMGANQLTADRQSAGQNAMAAQLAEQDKYRKQALGETLKMSDTYGDLPAEQQDAADQLFSKSRADTIGQDSAQGRLANLKANKASRASADIKGRGIAGVRQGGELQEMAGPLSTLLDTAKRDWALTPARMQSAMNSVGTPGLMTLGNLLQMGGQMGSLGYGLYNSGLFDPTKGAGGFSPVRVSASDAAASRAAAFAPSNSFTYWKSLR